MNIKYYSTVVIFKDEDNEIDWIQTTNRKENYLYKNSELKSYCETHIPSPMLSLSFKETLKKYHWPSDQELPIWLKDFLESHKVTSV